MFDPELLLCDLPSHSSWNHSSLPKMLLLARSVLCFVYAPLSEVCSLVTEVNVLDFMTLFPLALTDICRTCFPFSALYFEGIGNKNLRETEVTMESKVAEEKKQQKAE